MKKPKDILVITTAGADGIKIKKYLKPVSSHIVAGTNIFSDFLGGLTDVFGGRSNSYQKQLVSLYNEAINSIKLEAFDIGANCVVGLSIDMDEISGKNKSMFMLTAIGTAVIIEQEGLQNESISKLQEKAEIVSVERINLLKFKNDIIKKAANRKLEFDDDIWNFITENQVDEVYPYLINTIKAKGEFELFPEFLKKVVIYIEALPEQIKLKLLYQTIAEEQVDRISLKISDIVKELHLFDYSGVMQLLKNEDFKIRKRGIRIAKYEKDFYNKQDIIDLKEICDYVKVNFLERGTISTKKQLLSSKEKDVWVCECGKSNEMDDRYCGSCFVDIYGFKSDEVSPLSLINALEEKIELIKQFV